MTESLPLISFYFFGAITVAAALAVISVKNPVHAALCLVLTFFSTACTWLLADADFLAIALVLVYVGAVMVLFLFVVMMLDIDLVPLREGFVRAMPVGLVVAVVMLVEMLALIGVKARSAVPFAQNAAAPVAPGATATPNTTWLANALFTDFLLPFEVAAVILTIAVIAAVMLTLRRRVGAKHQDPSWQTSVRARDRVRIVSVPTERPPVEPTATDTEEGKA